MGMFDNIRAWWNDLSESMEDPVKLAKLQVADLEKALEKAKEEAAIVVGRPAGLRIEVSKLESMDADFSEKIPVILAKDRELAKKYASKQAEVRRQLNEKRVELESAESVSKDWADRIEMLEKAISDKKRQSQALGARSAMANAETKLGKAMDKVGGILGDDNFSRFDEKIKIEEQKAAGYRQMSGMDDAMLERKILEEADAESLLAEYEMNSKKPE